MGVDTEIVIIGVPDAPSNFVELTPGSPGSPGERRWLPLLFLGLLIAGVAAVVTLGGVTVDDSQAEGFPGGDPPIPALSASEDAAIDSTDVSDELVETVGDALAPLDSRFPHRPGDSDEPLLLAFGGSHRVLLVDIGTGLRDEWQAPELLAAAEPIALDGMFVVAGETRAWARGLEPDSEWIDIGAGDLVRPSSKPDRVWLRSQNVKETPNAAEYLWQEVDLAGNVHRSMFRSQALEFETPELVSGLSGAIFRLTDEPVNPWRVVSDYAYPVAIGVNDLVSRQCTANGECRRVWIDTKTGEQRQPIYSDLADNIDVSSGARLSPDGRFLMVEDASGGVDITSIATGAPLGNSCRWDEPITWTAMSELVACTTNARVKIYTTDTGGSIGLSVGAVNLGAADLAFVSAV